MYGNPNIGNVTTFNVKGLAGGLTYYFKVRAGNDCQPGPYSEEIAVKAGGKFINAPAIGFKPGVLGKATKNKTVASPSASPIVSVKPQSSESNNTNNGGLLGKIFNFFSGFFKP